MGTLAPLPIVGVVLGFIGWRGRHGCAADRGRFQQPAPRWRSNPFRYQLLHSLAFGCTTGLRSRSQSVWRSDESLGAVSAARADLALQHGRIEHGCGGLRRRGDLQRRPSDQRLRCHNVVRKPGQPDPVERGQGEVVELPASPVAPVEIALEELEFVYAYIFARVGNRADAEDLTQQVALKAIPRLRSGASPAAIRSYLFATARSALATFWSSRFGLPQEELPEDVWVETAQPEPTRDSVERVDRILSQLPANYRKLLELRFLRGYSLKEVASELGTTLGGIKVMQLRALRAAARVASDV